MLLNRTYEDNVTYIKQLIILLLLIKLSDNQPPSLVCPSKCRCTDISTDCSFSSLYNIPHDIDPKTQHLDLSGNQINRLEVEAFKRFFKIQTVNFSNNNMEYIDQKSLLIFVEVKNIDLSHNKLVNISPLMGMPKLKYLNLSYNEITLDIQLKGRFAKPYLLELDLSHNNLIDMKQESLSTFEKIGKLVLSKNRFKTLKKAFLMHFFAKNQVEPTMDLYIEENKEILKFENNFFENLYLKSLHLRHSSMNDVTFMKHVQANFIDLSDNPINYETFSMPDAPIWKQLYLRNTTVASVFKSNGMPTLELLDLSYNKFTNFSFHTPLKTESLKYLDLSHNSYLTELDQHLVKEMPSLIVMNLSHCNFNKLPMGVFDFTLIEEINLSNNRIRKIPNFNPGVLVKFDISENPLHCNCEMSWISEFCENLYNYDKRHLFENIECKTPSTMLLLDSPLVCQSPSDVHFNNDTYITSSQSSLEISCDASGDPNPTLTLYLNDMQLSRTEDNQLNDERSHLVYNLDSVTEMNEGQYTCVAENLEGRVEKAFHLVVYIPTVPITKTSTTTTTSTTTKPSTTITTRRVVESDYRNTFDKTVIFMEEIITTSTTASTSTTTKSTTITISTTTTTTTTTTKSTTTSTTTITTTTTTTTTTTITTTTRATTTSTTTTPFIIISRTSTTTTSTVKRTSKLPYDGQRSTTTSHLFKHRHHQKSTTTLHPLHEYPDAKSVDESDKITNKYRKTSTPTSTVESDDIRKIDLNIRDNKVAVIVAGSIGILVLLVLVLILFVYFVRKRHRQRKYLLKKRDAYLKSFPKNGYAGNSFDRRVRSNSGMLTTPLTSNNMNSLDRPRNGFDLLREKENNK